MIRSLLRTAAAASLVALGASSAAAQKQVAMCSTDNLVCFGAALSLSPDNSILTIDLQNQGSAYSQITGFGLFESPVDGPVESYGTLTYQFYNGTSFQATPVDFAVALGAVPGLNTPNSGVEYTFGDDGLTPCGLNMTTGDNVDIPTCQAPINSFLRLTFTGVSQVQSIDALNLAVRFQSVSGNPGSYKCYTGINPNGQDCVLVPGGGVGTGTLVPEPSTYALMGTGLLGLMGVAARRRRQG
jgi:hypothetical protein